MSFEVTQPRDEVGTHFYNPSKCRLRNVVGPPSHTPTSVIPLRPLRPLRERSQPQSNIKHQKLNILPGHVVRSLLA
jgi:hypothetical protein